MTGRVNDSAYGVWSKAEGVQVEIVEMFTRTCLVRMLSDFGAHKKGSIALILRDWVTVDEVQP